MSSLRSCPACGVHIHAAECTCPFCGARSCAGELRSTTRTAALLSLALAACGPLSPQVKYGIAETGMLDRDGDGYSVDDGDCDDDDDAIHPDATETPGDGVDSNCNDEDDT